MSGDQVFSACRSELRATGVAVDLPQGAIGPVRVAGREILRRIFVTLRDGHWSEIPPAEWIVTVTGDLSIGIEARHTAGEIDFAWQGEFSVDPVARRIRFAFEGTAATGFDVCRLGLVLLAAPDIFSGAEITCGGAGVHQWMRMPHTIAPQRIVEGRPSGITEPFSRLSVLTPQGDSLNFGFTGDLFELEDQRNWGDASYKIYCTPLRLGFPRRIGAGAVIRHEATLDYSDRGTSGGARVLALRDISRSTPCPPIGARALAEASPWRFVSASGTGTAAPVDEIPTTATLLSAESRAVLPFERLGSTARFLLSGDGAGLPSRENVAALRRACDNAGRTGDRIFATTTGHFVEFNRGEPFVLPVDGIAIPLSPTVHGEDIAGVFENVAAIAPLVATARQLTGVGRIAIAPLEWRRGEPEGAEGVAAESVELWLLASVIAAARAGAHSITLGQGIARRVERDGGLGKARRLLEEWADAMFAFPDFGDPDLHAAIVERRGERRLIAINLGGAVRQLRVAHSEPESDTAIITVPARAMREARLDPDAAGPA